MKLARICDNCGAELRDGEVHCHQCGILLPVIDPKVKRRNVIIAMSVIIAAAVVAAIVGLVVTNNALG